MSTDTWGLLAKSQDDPTTIDEAIAEAIANHNDDNTSHTETGQSLENHRTDDIVDHPAGSVLADKITMTEIYQNISFESIDAFITSGGVILQGVGDLYLEVDNLGTSNSYLVTPIAGAYQPIKFTRDFLFQTCVSIEYEGLSRSIFGFCEYTVSPLSDSDGAYFYFDGDELFAKFKNSAVNLTSSAITAPSGFNAVYRIQHIASERKLRYYVNGLLVYEVDTSELSDTFDGSNYATFRSLRDTGDTLILHIYQLIYSFSL
jgi:hypothetical protein